MLDEMSPYEVHLQDDVTPERKQDLPYDVIRAAVEAVFAVETAEFEPHPEVTAVFTGRLLIDSEEAYDKLDAQFAPLNQFPSFREQDGVQIIQVIPGRFNPRPRPWWPNAVLLVLTILSLLYIGAGIALGDVLLADPGRQLAEMWRGWPYAAAIVLILGAHELGHYFAARYHRLPVTLPYFIPLPFGFFGTLGAFIQLRAPLRNRKALLDVGAAGPIVGMIFAIPILLIGLSTADVKALPVNTAYLMEGNSILYALSKIITFKHFLPDGRVDVILNQLAQAGWTGLFVTGLNLIPVGQLDGGHVIYTLLGDRARRLYLPAMLAMAVLAFTVSDAWLLWLFLLMVFGRAYATPLDMITPLDSRRRFIAILALVIFLLVFVPNPLRIVNPGGLPPVEAF